MSAAPVSILLVEDSRTQALQFSHSLQTQGYHVDWVATAEDALERLNTSLPDLVIVDYHLPGMNGDALARQIRLNVRTRAIPVLMLTQAREHSIERKGLESGADAYLPKSLAGDMMALRIKALLRRPRPTADEMAGDARRDTVAYRRPDVLLVDPSRGELSFIEGLLTREGYAVRVVSDPRAEPQVFEHASEWDGVVMSPAVDDVLDLCRRFDALRTGGDGPSFPIIVLERAGDLDRDRLAAIFASGADDAAPLDADPDALAVRIRALVRRKLVRDENRRIDRDWNEQQSHLQRAREETIAAEARASMAEALSRANAELEGANRQLKDAQTKLVQAAKMASLGELVAGIAHEINNPLAFILAHQATIERLLNQLDRETPGQPALEKALQRFTSTRLGLKRIEEIIANLRRFSRLDEVEFMTVDVTESLESVLTLLGHKLAGVAIERRYLGASELYCSSALFNQVFMNIVGNAADAMGGEGRITITTTSDEERYTIEVRDTGPGVPEDLRERVFEPFFTTKPVGAGTGLGLAIAFNVTQAHGGALSVSDADDGGACFTITIPRRSPE